MSGNGYGYEKTVLSQGLVCLNKNNNAYCVVIDGRRGTDDDRASLVLESNSTYGFILNTPPNRALIPTGRICNLRALKQALDKEVD